MSAAWVPITIDAAASQATRNALQRQLKGQLSVNGATFTRFLFSLPLATLYLLALVAGNNAALPAPHRTFWFWVVAAAVSQIVATSLQILVTTSRNFATGIAYTKTEVVQAAIFEILFLKAMLTGLGKLGIALGTVAVMLMYLTRSDRP